MTQHTILSAGQALQQVWTDTIDEVQRAAAARRLINSALDTRFGPYAGYCSSVWPNPPELREMYARLVRLLERVMRDAFERSGMPVTLDLGELAVAPFPRWSDAPDHDEKLAAFARTLDFEAIAKKLASRFTPEQVQAQSLAEAAGRVDAYFRPRHSGDHEPSIKPRSGRMVIQTHAWQDSYTAWRLSTRCSEQLGQVLLDLSTLAAATPAQAALSDTQITTLRTDMLRHDWRYCSRERFILGSGLFLVLFKEKIEFHFTPALLEAVQIAVAEHAPQLEEPA